MVTESSKQEAEKKPDPNEGAASSSVDGGWSWAVCIGGFIVHFVVMGLISSGGVVYAALMDEFRRPRGETAWVSSLGLSASYLFAPVSTTLSRRYGCRLVTIIGGLLCITGLLASSFCTSLPPLYFTYGLVWGMGQSFCYFSAFLIIPKYFKARIALAYGIVTCGASMGGIALSPLTQLLFSVLSVSNTFRALAVLYLPVILSSLVFRPVKTNVAATKRRMFDWTILQNKGFLVYALSTSMFMFGHLVPYVHLVRMAEDIGAGKSEASFLPMYSGIASGIGRLVFGRIADLKCCIRLYLCQAALVGMSVAAFLVPGVGSSYIGLVSYSCARGLFEGCYIMVNPVVTSELVGKEKLSYALGASYLLMFVPRILGPPIAGWIFDAFKSYDIAFHYTGAVALLSCCMMFAIPCFEPKMRMNNKWKLSEEGKEGKQDKDQEPHEENKLGWGQEIREEKELGWGQEIDEEKKLGWGPEPHEEK